MKLEHVGLNIQKEEELVDFYQTILGFNAEYQFDMNPELCGSIFGMNKQCKVFLCKRESVLFELFVHSQNQVSSFSHVCLAVNDREGIAKNCLENDYPVIRVERIDRPDILFVKDKAGNVFELKPEEKA